MVFTSPNFSVGHSRYCHENFYFEINCETLSICWTLLRAQHATTTLIKREKKTKVYYGCQAVGLDRLMITVSSRNHCFRWLKSYKNTNCFDERSEQGKKNKTTSIIVRMLFILLQFENQRLGHEAQGVSSLADNSVYDHIHSI